MAVFAEEWCAPRFRTALSRSAQTCLSNLCNRPLVSYPGLAANGWVVALRYGQGQSAAWDFPFFSVSQRAVRVSCNSEGAPLPLGLA